MKIRAALAAVAVAAGLLLPVTSSPVASASADCKPTYTFGVGGFQIDLETFPPSLGQPSLYIQGADQPVGYNSIDINDGAREIERLFREYRSRCPGSHIKILGHSGGAAAAHVWVSRHPDEENVTVILVADPKRPPGPGNGGIAGHFLAVPANLLGLFAGAAGTDSNYGRVPVLTICNAGDWVCNRDASPQGWAFGTVHGQYDLNPNNYPNFISGQWYNDIY